MTPLFMDYYGNMHSGASSKMDVRLLRNFRAAVTHRCSRLNSGAASFPPVFASPRRRNALVTIPLILSISSPFCRHVRLMVSRKKFLDTLLVNRSALLNLIFSCATYSQEFISSFGEFQADCSLSRI